MALIHSLTHSLTHSLPHTLTHSLIHSLTHSLPHTLTHTLTHKPEGATFYHAVQLSNKMHQICLLPFSGFELLFTLRLIL